MKTKWTDRILALVCPAAVAGFAFAAWFLITQADPSLLRGLSPLGDASIQSQRLYASQSSSCESRLELQQRDSDCNISIR
jgi:hypothetical protein